MVILGTVTADARRHQVAFGRLPALALGRQVIQCDLLGTAAAIGAATIPGVNDYPAKPMLGVSLWHKLGPLDSVHVWLDGGWAGS